MLRGVIFPQILSCSKPLLGRRQGWKNLLGREEQKRSTWETFGRFLRWYSLVKVISLQKRQSC